MNLGNDINRGNFQNFIMDNDDLNLLATSIKRCASGMGCWSAQEITLGLYGMFKKHNKEGAIDTIPGSCIDAIEDLEELCCWIKWAKAAYLQDKVAIASSLQINEAHVKKHVYASAVLRPSYYIAVDNQNHNLVFAIRGTQSVNDIMTDLNPHSEKFEKGFAHSGILSAAKWLMKEESENIRILLGAYPGYKLVLTGHSLGAGIASLLSLLLQDFLKKLDDMSTHNDPMLVCWGFGCPPCLDEQFSEKCTAIRNIVLQDDIIARLSPFTLEQLRREISKVDWSESLPGTNKFKGVVDLVQKTHGFVNNLEASLGYDKDHFARQIKSFCSSSIASARQPENRPISQSSRATKLSGWLPSGATALLQYAANNDSGKMEREFTALSITNPSAAGDADTSKSSNVPLCVPGILYHIVYKNYSMLTAIKDAHVTSDGASRFDTSQSNGDSASVMSHIQYYVIRGTDPAVRFTRIILSNTMVADHSCQSYERALDGALKSQVKALEP